jgi:hypothetical protein
MLLAVDHAKENGAVLIAASIVAAIRLRGQEIKPSPKLNGVVHDSILLARTIWRNWKGAMHDSSPLSRDFVFPWATREEKRMPC